MYVGPLLDLLDGGLEAGHEVLWGPPRPSLHAPDRDEDEDGNDKDNADVRHAIPNEALPYYTRGRVAGGRKGFSIVCLLQLGSDCHRMQQAATNCHMLL